MSRYDALENFYLVKEANSRAKNRAKKERRRARRQAAKAQQAPSAPNAAQVRKAQGMDDFIVGQHLKKDRIRYDKQRAIEDAFSELAEDKRIGRQAPKRLNKPVTANMLPARMSDNLKDPFGVRTPMASEPDAAKLRRMHGLSDSFQGRQLSSERLKYDRRQRRRVRKARFAEDARRHGMSPREYARLQTSVPADMLPARMSDTSMATTTQPTTSKAPKKLRASYTNTPPVASTARQIGSDAASSASSASPRMLTGPKQLTVPGSPRGSSAAASAAQSAGGMSNLAKGGIAAGILGLGGAYLYNRNRQQQQQQ